MVAGLRNHAEHVLSAGSTQLAERRTRLSQSNSIARTQAVGFITTNHSRKVPFVEPMSREPILIEIVRAW